ncbi:hypothetical protein OG500_23570 [Kitasatospora sp. NBC_01250]|uniref:hypothetical protein n=1 Tax=unclassified Kitasatospora TaxID=2633591 RepID=UPI002E106FA0|nr:MULTISPECIES: hypothetical protein [unclassified Kitasatospora]WSJ69129.1 hypothetical protein OG294_25115 [Kitasatospora sp. NBC_01302]
MVIEEGAARGRRRRRRPLRWVLTSLLLVGAVIAGLVLWNRNHLGESAEQCEVTQPGGKPVTMDLDQGSNAATIAAVSISRGLPERALTIALATGMQESKLHNLAGGDRDSVGLFQQRPSQGWGTEQQIMDPVYATNKFLDALVKVQGYARLPLTEAAQDVQKSGYPGAYAKHEANATLLAEALTGHTQATFSCTVNSFPQSDQVDTGAASPSGTASPAAPSGAQLVTLQVQREFGRAVAASPATSSPAISGATTSPALALTPDPGLNTGGGQDAQLQSGWAVAQWAVAHAQELSIGTVAYNGKVWRIDRSSGGWQPLAGATSTTQVLVTLGMPSAKH